MNYCANFKIFQLLLVKKLICTSRNYKKARAHNIHFVMSPFSCKTKAQAFVTYLHALENKSSIDAIQSCQTSKERLSVIKATIVVKFEKTMAEGVSRIQGLLVRLKENIAQFHESVETQAEMAVSKERRELRKKFKAEQEEMLKSSKKERNNTEELFTDITRYVRQCLGEVKCEKDEKLKAVTRAEKLKNSKELKEIITKTRNDTIAKLSSCSESQLMEISENPDLVLTWAPRCASCGEERAWLYFCEACRVTRYCDENCQAADWERHQHTCAGLN